MFIYECRHWGQRDPAVQISDCSLEHGGIFLSWKQIFAALGCASSGISYTHSHITLFALALAEKETPSTHRWLNSFLQRENSSKNSPFFDLKTAASLLLFFGNVCSMPFPHLVQVRQTRPVNLPHNMSHIG